jgi:polar amino acid transport system permease protein
MRSQGRSSPHGAGLILDCLVALAALAVFAWLAHRIGSRLNYAWRWSELGRYLFWYDSDAHQLRTGYLVQGLLVTLRLSLYAILPALVLGLVMALARTSRDLFLRMVGRTYIETLRNLPPLVVIFLVYFFLTDQITPLTMLGELVRGLPETDQSWLELLIAPPASFVPFISAVCTLALFESAYFAEIFRAAIGGVDQGQWEAGQSLGMNRLQVLALIILPQAVRQSLPALAGQGISLIKDSSIVSVISIQELTYQGSQLMASTYMTFEVWLAVAALYFLLTFPCSLALSRLEQRYAAQVT